MKQVGEYNMKALLVAGGTIQDDFAKEYIAQHSFDLKIGVDGGTKFFYETGLEPDLLVGDFDTLSPDILKQYENDGVELLKFPPEKDYTDTQIALTTAIERGCSEVVMLGATGTRLDHVLGNIAVLTQAHRQGIRVWMMDAYNRIHVVAKSERIEKEKQFGKYVSFYPLTPQVAGVTLEGFAYPLENAVLTNDNSLAISNEITEQEAKISYEEGLMLMLETRDNYK